MAKTGLFFAKADGSYSAEEKNFIEAFIDQLNQVGPADEVKDALEEALNVSYSLETIVAHTKDTIDGLNEDEKTAVLATLASFIQNVIAIDGKTTGAEVEAFEAWKKALA